MALLPTESPGLLSRRVTFWRRSIALGPGVKQRMFTGTLAIYWCCIFKAQWQIKTLMSSHLCQDLCRVCARIQGPLYGSWMGLLVYLSAKMVRALIVWPKKVHQSFSFKLIFPVRISLNITQSPHKLYSGYLKVAGRFFFKDKVPDPSKAVADQW